ncbi:hypothetical protein CL634_07300 [bacterium]|nr:hypothetical protein [bacterium]
MASFSHNHDIGARLKGFNALNAVVVTAGTTADGNQYDGFIYDRLSVGGTNTDLFLSAKCIVQYDAAGLANTVTATIAQQWQHSSSTASTAFSDITDIDGSTAVSTVVTGTTAVAAFSGVSEADLDLSQRKRYIRIQVTPTLSTTATDTVDIGAVLVFGGGDGDPAN